MQLREVCMFISGSTMNMAKAVLIQVQLKLMGP